MAYQAAKETFSRDEILDILRRNVELYRNEPTFVNYIVDLAMYLLECQGAMDQPDSGSQDLDPLSAIGMHAVGGAPAQAQPHSHVADHGSSPGHAAHYPPQSSHDAHHHHPGSPHYAPPPSSHAPPSSPGAPIGAPQQDVADIELANVHVFPSFLETNPGFAKDQDPKSTPGSYTFRPAGAPAPPAPPAQSPAAAAYRNSFSGGGAGAQGGNPPSSTRLQAVSGLPPSSASQPSSTGGFISPPREATKAVPIRQPPSPQASGEKPMPKVKIEQSPRTRVYKVFRSHTSSVEVPKCPICGSETRGTRTCPNCGHIL